VLEVVCRADYEKGEPLSPPPPPLLGQLAVISSAHRPLELATAFFALKLD